MDKITIYSADKSRSITLPRVRDIEVGAEEESKTVTMASGKTVKDILGDVKVTAFTRYQLGEGIEKKQENFAAEVAAQMK